MIMLLLSAIPPQHSFPNPSFFPPSFNSINHCHQPLKPQNCCSPFSSLHPKPFFLPNSSSSSSSSSTFTSTLRYVNNPILEEEAGEWVPSASAVASAIRKASSSPIEFTQKIESDPKSQGLVLPSPDFQRLCLDQLALFRRIVDPNAVLSKAMLLQQTSWQNNIRMSNLVEQIRGPLSSLRTLSKMLSVHVKSSEIAQDIIEDIIVQGDRMLDTLQQLQDAVLLTKANIMRFNEESLKKMDSSICAQPEKRTFKLPKDTLTSTSPDKKGDLDQQRSSSLAVKDLEMPMPPLALAPLQQHINRSCNVSDILVDLVGAAQPLAQNNLELSEFSQHLPVAVEESALRQALSNLIEGALLRTHVGGKVEILSVGAPAGGVLVVIDDDGPDMHYMTQMHSLTPFGAELVSEKMVEDNMTWNFVAGLTIAREILESYGCVVRVISPRDREAALGTGGTRVEVWLPSSIPYNHEAAAEA